MEYRRLGNTGLKVSVLSFGSWVTFHNQLGSETALRCMQAAWETGVNFFDNAEVYAGGKSEVIMGQVARELGWPRESYVISTKLDWGPTDGPNTKNPNVSTVITGASRVEQLHENMGALEVIPRLTDEVLARLEGAGGSAP